ncbi:hypothetical protein HNP82_000609 [Catenibacillus scindens]|uniref:Card1 endonuclease domain-containing protein n=1 Tax=Catenibacillus scindens TaxID=673271 RepID=A0A7W8H7V3_9FIRM|nr:DUF1887 family CARF protein [Catenibacillus scindens]MBB5263511.1 hypothetical protein [Catenibacillus scindens]
MEILIEFYHKNILENMTAVLGVQPDIVMFYFDPRFFTHTAVYDTYLACRKYIPHLKLELGVMDSDNYWAMEEKLLRYAKDNGNDHIIIDLSGCNPLSAVAACQSAGRYDLPMVCADLTFSRIICLNDPVRHYGFHSFELSDLIEACGGKVIACADSDYLDKNRDNLLSMAAKVLENSKTWLSVCTYLQKHGGNGRGGHSRHFSGPAEYRGKNKNPVPDTKIMHFLARTQLIQNLTIKNNQIQFDYKDKESAGYLTTYGIWLEFKTYYALKASKKFHDVKNSLKVDWNRNDTQDIIGNEIDVTAMYGCIPVVVSCKMSENATDADAVNELYAVSHRISPGHVIQVLVTWSDIKQKRQGIYMKAKEMGIIVMDKEDIRHGDFPAKLERAICQKRTIIR